MRRLLAGGLGVAAVGFAIAACGGESPAPDAPISLEAIAPALASVSGDDLLRRIEVLAHDSMEGRGPGTVGEERAVAYLEGEFRRIGLGPGNPDGTYIQDV